jgi:hypothetical protein
MVLGVLPVFFFKFDSHLPLTVHLFLQLIRVFLYYLEAVLESPFVLGLLVEFLLELTL